MRYKIGDRVRVREDLEIGQMFDNEHMFTKSMSEYRGKTVTIVSFNEDSYTIGMVRMRGKIVTIKSVHRDYYLIKEDEGFWSWTDEMFEGLASEDAPDIEVTAKAAINQLFRREPKFHDGDIVSRACGYYRVVGVPIYDNKCNSFVYDLAITPGNKTLTSEPIRENELTFVCRPKIEE